ncbi:MAG: hypothetical protein ABI234_01255 [Ktedonobacteraceae bacterium]
MTPPCIPRLDCYGLASAHLACSAGSRAQQRGELRSNLDATFLLNLIFGTLVYGNLFTNIIDPYAQQDYEPEAMVDALLRGIGTQ